MITSVLLWVALRASFPQFVVICGQGLALAAEARTRTCLRR